MFAQNSIVRLVHVQIGSSHLSSHKSSSENATWDLHQLGTDIGYLMRQDAIIDLDFSSLCLTRSKAAMAELAPPSLMFRQGHMLSLKSRLLVESVASQNLILYITPYSQPVPN
jgi:hypothetical protein